MTNLHSQLDKLLQNPEDPAAVAALQEANKDDVASLRSQYESAGQWHGVANLLEARIACENDNDTIIALLRDVGHICRETLDEPERALKHFREIVAREPNDVQALRAIAGILEETAVWDAWLETAGRLIALENKNPHLIDDYLKLATVLLQVGDRDAASQAYQNVLQRRPEDASAIQGLEGLLEQGADAQSLAKILEPTYSALQNHEKLAWLWEIQLRSGVEGSTRRHLLRRLAGLYETQLKRPRDAFGALQRLWRDDPEDVGVQAWLEKIADQLDNWRELSDLYLGVVQETTRSTLRIPLLRKSVAIVHGRLHDNSAAIGLYRAILADVAHDEKALSGLEEIFRTTDAFVDLISVLEEKAEHAQDVLGARALWLEAANLQERVLGERSAACRTYQRVLEHIPEDNTAWPAVERLLREQRRWPELVTLYREALARSEHGHIVQEHGRQSRQDAAHKTAAPGSSRHLELLFRLAHVLDVEMAEHADAMALFGEIVRIDPQHERTIAYLESVANNGRTDALTHLAEAYRASQRWDRYATVVETWLHDLTDVTQRRTLLHSLSNVYEEHLNKGADALHALLRAFQEPPMDVACIDAMERISGRFGLWAILAEKLNGMVEEIQNTDLQNVLRKRLAAIYLEQCHSVQDGVRCLLQVVRAEKNDDASWAKLDDVLTENGQWKAWIGVFGQRVPLMRQSHDKIELLFRLAEASIQHVHQPTEALAFCREVLALGSANQDEQVRAHTFCAQVCGDELGDVNTAITHWQHVRALQPGHEDANAFLEALLFRQERWKELAELCEQQLGGDVSSSSRAELHRRLGGLLASQLHQPDEAITHWRAVAELCPHDRSALQSLLQIYQGKNQWTDVVETWRRLLPLLPPSESKAGRIALVGVLGEQLKDRAGAAAMACDVLTMAPHTSTDLEQLVQALERCEAWDTLVVVLEEAARVETHRERRLAHYWQAVGLYEQKLQRPHEAVACLRSILALEPGDTRAYRSLIAVYQQTGAWRDVVETHEAFLPYAELQGRLAALVAIRDIYAEHLHDNDKAFVAACRVYKEHGHDLNTLDVLLQVGQRCMPTDDITAIVEDEIEQIADQEIRLATLWRLLDLYRAQGDGHDEDIERCLRKILTHTPGDMVAWEGLVTLALGQQRYDVARANMEAQLHYVEDDAQRVALLYALASLCEDRLSDTAQAIILWRQIMAIEPTSVGAVDALIRVFQQHDRFHELADVLTKKIDLGLFAADADTVPARMLLGQLCETASGDLEGAMRWYASVHALDPDHHDAAAGLVRLYTRCGQWDALIALWETQIQRAAGHDAVPTKMRLWAQMAGIYAHQLHDWDGAIRCYEDAVACQPTHAASLAELEHCLRERGGAAPTRLVEVMTQRLALAESVQEKAQIAVGIGDAWQQDAQHASLAEQSYRQALQFCPTLSDALDRLDGLYSKGQQWSQLADIVRSKISVASDGAAAVDLWVRLGQLEGEKRGDKAAAQVAYLEAVGLDPSCHTALRALRLLAEDGENQDVYSDLLVREAETTTNVADKADLFFDAATFFATHDQDTARAIEFYRRALGVLPNHVQSSLALGSLLSAQQLWHDAATLYEDTLSALHPVTQRQFKGALFSRAGEACEHAGDLDKAMQHYRHAIDAEPSMHGAQEGLARILMERGQWTDATIALQRLLVDQGPLLPAEGLADLHCRLGTALREQQQRDEAYEQFENAVRRHAAHVPALRALAELDEQRGQWQNACDRWEQLCAYVTDDADQVMGLRIRISNIAKDKMQDEARCVRALDAARALEASSMTSSLALTTAYQELGRWHQAIDVLIASLRVAGHGAEQGDVHFRLGHLYETGMQDMTSALHHYNAALDAVPTKVAAFEAIERILSASKSWELLESNYHAMLERSKELPLAARLILWRSLASLYRNVLHNQERAIATYELLRTMDATNADDMLALAELYAHQPDGRQKAINLYNALVGVVDDPVTPLRTMRRLYHLSQNFDAVYMICSALCQLGVASAEEKKTFEYLRRGTAPKAKGELTAEHWEHIDHPGLKDPIAVLAAAMYRSVPDHLALSMQDSGLKKREKIDLHKTELYFGKTMLHVSTLLHIPGVELFCKAGSMDAIQLANVLPPALTVGQHNPVLADVEQSQLLFQLGRNLAYARPETVLTRVFSQDELRDLMLGLCRVYNGTLPPHGEPTRVEHWRAIFAQLPAQTLGRLQNIAKEAYPALIGQGSGNGMEAYFAAAEYTATRAGLMACGDLGAALQGIKESSTEVSWLRDGLRRRDLVMFSVSASSLALRGVLGLSVAVLDEGGGTVA